MKAATMRKDAEQNRERLIAAASAMMRSMGDDVPMELIAERAGVSRPTLYRNFPDRQAMYEAVLERDLRAVAAAIAADPDPLGFLRHTAELMRVYDTFLARLVEMSDYDGAKNQKRMASILAAPLADAQRQGALHADITPGDMLVACRMLASHWKLDEQPDFARAFERRLALLTRGLLAAPAASFAAAPTAPKPARGRSRATDGV